VPHTNCEMLAWQGFVSAAATAQVRTETIRVLRRKRPLEEAGDGEIAMVLANAAL
jgi:hypothetical protein